jgi:hypothetical protein
MNTLATPFSVSSQCLVRSLPPEDSRLPSFRKLDMEPKRSISS